MLNIKIHDTLVMQIIHRAHFAELINSIIDDEFGLAVFIPYNWESQQQLIENLKKVLIEYQIWPGDEEAKKRDYVLIDMGIKLKNTQYLISNILKKGFHLDDEKKLKIDLYEEGTLPYSIGYIV